MLSKTIKNNMRHFLKITLNVFKFHWDFILFSLFILVVLLLLIGACGGLNNEIVIGAVIGNVVTSLIIAYVKEFERYKKFKEY